MARECVLYKELMKDLFVYIPSYGKCTISHEGHDQPWYYPSAARPPRCQFRSIHNRWTPDLIPDILIDVMTMDAATCSLAIYVCSYIQCMKVVVIIFMPGAKVTYAETSVSCSDTYVSPSVY